MNEKDEIDVKYYSSTKHALSVSETGCLDNGYETVQIGAQQKSVYMHSLPSKPGITMGDYPCIYEEIPGKVKASSSPNIALILKIVAILGSLFAVILLSIFVVAIINKGDGGAHTTTTKITPTTSKTTSVSTTTRMTTMSTESPNSWSSWGAWSDCSVTCGEGVNTRERTCVNGDVCTGTNVQTTPCSKISCPGPNYGEWTSWGNWGDCSASCSGGVQERYRTCEQRPNQELCPGSAAQTRNCNEYSCPSCTDSCPDGGVMEIPDCKRCSCPGKIFTGKVVDESDSFITGVIISDNKWPNIILNSTNHDGIFTLSDVCNGTTLRLSRAGYVDKIMLVTNESEVIPMQGIDYLTFSEHPQSKVRLVGESITLCCSANGNPPPDYYEWYKNGIIIENNNLRENNKLIIASVEEQDSGFYHCRANNDHITVFSNEAEVNVKGNPSDYCSTYPSPKSITLPRGCEHNEKNEVDVGECHVSPCRFDTGTDDNSCKENSGLYCCGPVGFDTTIVECSDGMQIPLSFVTSCGCIQCPHRIVQIQGTTIDEITNERIQSVDIVVNSTSVAKTSNSGKFLIYYDPIETPEIIIDVHDSSHKYFPTTKVVRLREVLESTVFVEFKLKARVLPNNSHKRQNLIPKIKHGSWDTCEFDYTVLLYPMCPGPNPDINSLAWFPRSLSSIYNVCFMKVYITNGFKEIIRAMSEMGTHSPPGESYLYGIRDKCASSIDESMCLEVKAAGQIMKGCTSYSEDSTLITLGHYRMTNSAIHCSVDDINNNLVTTSGDDIIQDGPDAFQMLIRNKSYGQDFGIYCETSSNEEQAFNLAEKKCVTGSDQGNDGIPNNNNWALKMTCNEHK